MKRRRLICLLAVSCLLLNGCASSVPIRQGTSVTLPPAKAVFQAPVGDESRDIVDSILLYLPSRRTGQLMPRAFTVARPPNRHPAETAVQKLLAFAGDEDNAPLIEGAQLSLSSSSGVEVSGDTATVDLGSSALALKGDQLAFVSRAVTNTLCQWDDIRYVNVLIAGKQPGTDIGATVPMGSLVKTGNEEAAWKKDEGQERFSAVATLYYPAPLGKGVLAEARAVTFDGRTMADMARGLLTALSAKAQTLGDVPSVPVLDHLLSSPVTVSESTAGSGRIIDIRFQEAANETFISHGIPRSIMMASIVLTLTTFLPNIEGVQITIGQETVSSIAPTGLEEGTKKQIVFKNGLMRRSDFTRFLLNLVSLYFAGPDDHLVCVKRALPYYQAQNARALYRQLLAGPNTAEAARQLRRTLPAKVSDADLIGFTSEKDTILLHFSDDFIASCQGLTPREEQLMVYSLVNTVSSLRGIRRVRFYVMDKQPETFSGSLYLPGEFLANPSI